MSKPILIKIKCKTCGNLLFESQMDNGTVQALCKYRCRTGTCYTMNTVIVQDGLKIHHAYPYKSSQNAI